MSDEDAPELDGDMFILDDRSGRLAHRARGTHGERVRCPQCKAVAGDPCIFWDSLHGGSTVHHKRPLK